MLYTSKVYIEIIIQGDDFSLFFLCKFKRYKIADTAKLINSLLNR